MADLILLKAERNIRGPCDLNNIFTCLMKKDNLESKTVHVHVQGWK